ncbi:HalOD1 output domain-containing protein [Halosolutus amylolyticus]|uniref:HalOD1 output domain-containing protein n=1 Tax=Halosolutus amylolyticus TaxID=2932267 RepID=A0ABD5PVE8_9EURY|nr:HalOD1 output domain-containing protein [Halosolutus amylolyticus]
MTRTTIERQYDDDTPASVAIVDGISTLEGTDGAATTDELGFRLYDYVDPEALDTIVAEGSGAGDVVVSFRVEAYHVTVTNAGRIRIRFRE